MNVKPGDTITILPDGTIIGPIRFAYETTPEGGLVLRCTVEVERGTVEEPPLDTDTCATRTRVVTRG